MRRWVRAAAVAAACVAALAAWSKPKATSDPWAGYDEAVYMDLDLDANIASPALDPLDRPAVVKHMRHLQTELASKKYITELERNDEVVVVTIPAEQLFMPNDTLLSPRAEQKLKPLTHYLKPGGNYKLVYAVHSDNTGSEEYNYDLSQQRVNSIYDWLLDHVSEDVVVIPYAMGDADPVESNNTRAGRRANRRVEFWLIPGPDLILRLRGK